MHEGEVQALHRKANEIARELADQGEVGRRLETELGEARNALEERDQQIEAARADVARARDEARGELEAAQARVHELEQRVTETREALRIGVGERLWGA
jgi:chromosome segregation ATPase